MRRIRRLLRPVTFVEKMQEIDPEWRGSEADAMEALAEFACKHRDTCERARQLKWGIPDAPRPSAA